MRFLQKQQALAFEQSLLESFNDTSASAITGSILAVS